MPFVFAAEAVGLVFDFLPDFIEIPMELSRLDGGKVAYSEPSFV
jgi:hypothetical protein